MYYLLRVGFRDLCEWIYFAFETTLRGRRCGYYFHFTDEEIEAQLGLTNLPSVTQLVYNVAKIWIPAV